MDIIYSIVELVVGGFWIWCSFVSEDPEGFKQLMITKIMPTFTGLILIYRALVYFRMYAEFMMGV